MKWIQILILSCALNLNNLPQPAFASDDLEPLASIRSNISALWKALDVLRSEVHEKFDTHVAIETHEHHVHHLGHEDSDHEAHHSEKHLQHLEQVHGVTAVGLSGIEPHKPHTVEEKHVLRHEHDVHHANTSQESEIEHADHHDAAMLRHLEEEDGHGEHKGVHHGKQKKELDHELEEHFSGAMHEGHDKHHNEILLKHLEEEDGHGPRKGSLSVVDIVVPPAARPRKAKVEEQYAESIIVPNRAGNSKQRGGLKGKATLVQKGKTLTIHLEGHFHGKNSKSLHGFHVHELAAEDSNCNLAGPHYNPHGANHGGPNVSARHVGDLGNVEADEQGNINVTIQDSVATLSGPLSILNRTLVIHEKADDLGLDATSTDSLTTGSAGRRLACGVIRAVEKPSST